MAAFCVSCGNPLADGAKFCTKCGATQPAARCAGGDGMPPAPAAPASKGSSTGDEDSYRRAGVFHVPDPGGGGQLCLYWLPGQAKERTSSRKSMGGQRQALHRQTAALRHVVHQRGLGGSGRNGCIGRTARHHGLRVLLRLRRRKHFDVDYAWEGGGIAMGLAHGAMKHVAGMDTFTTRGRHRRRGLHGSGKLVAHDAQGRRDGHDRSA